MSKSPQPLTLDDVWVKLFDGIEYIFQFQTTRYSKWMLLYTHIFDYCTDKKNSSADLYESLRNYLRNYVENFCQSTVDWQDKDKLDLYINQWKKYRRSSKILHGICSYLNRNYVRRESDSDNSNICEIFPMAMQVWQQVVSRLFYKQITQICLNMINAERNSENINTDIINNVIQTYVTSNINEQTSDAEMLEVYQEYFEDQFLRETQEFYRNKSITYLQQHSVVEYLTNIPQYFNEEIYRVTTYLHPSTTEKLVKKLEEVLIHDQLKVIYDVAKILVHDEKVQELNLLYQTVSRVENGEVELKRIVENHIHEIGIETIERINPISIHDLKVYIQTIYGLHQKYFIFIQEAFAGDRGFFDALDRACRKFINVNAVIQTVGGITKMVEYLSRYCDKLLRKGDNEEIDLDTIFNQIKIVLYYTQEKDVFERFYSKMLAKRLINLTNVSIDNEKLMISNIQDTCGFGYAFKMKQMCQDIETSKNLLDQYQQYCNNQQIIHKINFTVMILHCNAWSLSTPSNIILPDKLKFIFDTFTDFYNHLQHGRKLIWHYQHSKGELQTYFTDRTYTLQVSMYQMVILLLFNNSSEWTVEKIHDETQINIELLLQILNTLLQSNILICEQIDLKEINLDKNCILKLSNKFVSDKHRVNLNVPLKSVEQKDVENFHQKIDDDRIMVIQATIVRIMKLHKTMNQNLLIQTVLQQLTSHFNPDVSIIKNCINVLIEKEYLERQFANTDILCYLA